MAVIVAGLASPAHASQTPAGAKIANVASMSFDQGGTSTSVPSNAVTLTVVEVLDVTVVAAMPTVKVTTTEVVPVAFTVTNSGNAPETFSLAATRNGTGGTILGIAADVDNNGSYTAGTDSSLTPPSLLLQPGQARRIFVLVRGDEGTLLDGDVTLQATATTGHGDRGTVFAGAGEGGVDAVVGATGAQASAQTLFNHDGGLPQLEKSQTVVAPDGSARVMPGAIITYRLEARFTQPAAGVDVSDTVPEGTTFVPGSLVLDDQPLTDAADDDRGTFDGTAVHVALGTVAGAGVRVIRFQTIIQ